LKEAISCQLSVVSYQLSVVSCGLLLKKMGVMQNFRDLKVWHKSHLLTLAIYKATKNFPKEEMYGLTSQMRRSASSIPANIAEGCCRGGNSEFARFLRIAIGSASELEYHVLLARDLELLSLATYGELENQVTEVKRMLAGLIQKVKKDPRCSKLLLANRQPKARSDN